jgi:hypothetical protein
MAFYAPPPITELEALSVHSLNLLLLATPHWSNGFNPVLAYGRNSGSYSANPVERNSNDARRLHYRIIDGRKRVCEILESWLLVGEGDWEDYMNAGMLHFMDEGPAESGSGSQGELENCELTGLFTTSPSCLIGFQPRPLSSEFSLGKMKRSVLFNIAKEYSDISQRSDMFRVFNLLKHSTLETNKTINNRFSKETISATLYMNMIRTCLLSTSACVPRLYPAVILLAEMILMHGDAVTGAGPIMKTVAEQSVKYGNSLSLHHLLEIIENRMETAYKGKFHRRAKMLRLSAQFIPKEEVTQQSYFPDDNCLPGIFSSFGADFNLDAIDYVLRLRERFNGLIDSGERVGVKSVMTREAYGSLISAYARIFSCRLSVEQPEKKVSSAKLFGVIREMLREGHHLDVPLRRNLSVAISMSMIDIDSTWFDLEKKLAQGGGAAADANDDDAALEALYNSAIAHIILGACSIRGDVNRTFSTYEAMEAAGIVLDKDGYLDLLRAIAVSWCPNETAMNAVVVIMREKGVEVGEEARHYMCMTLLKDDRTDHKLLSAFEMIQECMLNGEEVKEDTMVIIARKLAKCNHWEHVEEVLRWIEFRFQEVPMYLRVRIETLQKQRREEQDLIDGALAQRDMQD